MNRALHPCRRHIAREHTASTHKAFYAVKSTARQLSLYLHIVQTIRDLRRKPVVEVVDDSEPADNDIILSILRANPSVRDTKNYLASFGSPYPRTDALLRPAPAQEQNYARTNTTREPALTPEHISSSPVIASILNPIHRRTALVKIEGPFTDRQLESIARGIVYLEKLGLLSVIVVENHEIDRGDEGERAHILEETMRVVQALELQGARARPILSAVVRLGPKPGKEEHVDERETEFNLPEAHTLPSDLAGIRSALLAGEIPVLPPMALDSFVRSMRIDANDVLAALARGMVEAAAIQDMGGQSSTPSNNSINLTPLRLMIINREGGIPSYARSGLPHLLVNTTSEFQYIHDTFQKTWHTTHPTALANLALARTCLAFMPPASSAVMVSHRSPSSLIANLITNKPAVSSSLPHALLQGKSHRRLTPHTPTLLRRGLPIRVVRDMNDVDRAKMKHLLEASFGRTLDEAAFWGRLERDMDFCIVAGDYAGAAIVTNERAGTMMSEQHEKIAYLDKFAVLPSHQGDGTVDFLWVALHDETYGLGLSYSANPNGGKGGKGIGRDLVWRSRANNPVNGCVFERSSGHVRLGTDWVLFGATPR